MILTFCVESSFERGMGHLYRSLRLANDFKKINNQLEIRFILNEDAKSQEIIKSNDFTYYTVKDFYQEGWESDCFNSFQPEIWINDRLNTTLKHVTYIKKNVKKVITFDDRGEGSVSSDVNIAPLIFGDNLCGIKVLQGLPFLVLDSDLKQYQRERCEINNVLVSLGGSDNYGLTELILNIIENFNFNLTIHLGPLNRQEDAIRMKYPRIKIVKNLESLGELFYKNDLLISGGGMLPFEAIATGLPVLCCASEDFEIPVCKHIEENGFGFFVGYRDEISLSSFNKAYLSIKNKIKVISQNELNCMDFDASLRIYKEVFNEK